MKVKALMAWVVIISVVVSSAIAQTGHYLNSPYYSNFIPRKPEKQSLGTFGNTPINYYTGLPEISFELMRLKGRACEVPVTINYDATGVRTDDLSGTVGIKWSLNAGGFIMREMNGIPDEHPVEGYWKYSLQTNYYQNLNIPEWTNWCEKNERDGSPDEFSIVINGRQIRFIFNKNKKAIPVPAQNVLIETSVVNNRLYRFEMTVEDGTKYVFGGDVNSVEERNVETLNIAFKFDYKYARDIGNHESWMYEYGSEKFSEDVSYEEKKTEFYTSKWHLTSITLPSGEVTTFTYQKNGNVSYVSRPGTVRVAPLITRLDPYSYTEEVCMTNSPFGCLDWETVSRGPFYNAGAVLKFPKTDPGNYCTRATPNSPCDGQMSNGYFEPDKFGAGPGSCNSYHTLITESNIRLLSIQAATGSKIVFTYSGRSDLPSASKIDAISLFDMNNNNVSTVKLNYREVAANENNDFLWPGEAVILLNVGPLALPVSDFYAKDIRQYFSSKLTDTRLIKYCYEGLKEYNYKRSFLESIDQYARNASDKITMYEFVYKDCDQLKRRTTPLHDAAGYTRTNGLSEKWVVEPGKNAVMANGRSISFSEFQNRMSGMLTRINYPSGGHTLFTYGSTARLQYVQDFDETGRAVNQKELQFLSMEVNSPPIYISYEDFNIWGTSDWMKYAIVSSSPQNDSYALTHGAPDGAKIVNVYQGTKLSNIGYEQFTFSSPVDGIYRDGPTNINSVPVDQDHNGQDMPFARNIFPFPPNRDRDYVRGLLLNHKVFANGTALPLRESRYSYVVNPSGYTPETMRGFKGGTFSWANHGETDFWKGYEPNIEVRYRYGLYGYAADWIVLQKRREIIYDQQIPADTSRNFDITTEYVYDPKNLQLVETRVYNRHESSEQIISNTRYVTHPDYEYAAQDPCDDDYEACMTGCDRSTCAASCRQEYQDCVAENIEAPETTAIRALRLTHRISSPVEIQTLTTSGGQTSVTSSVIYKYRMQGSQIFPREIWGLSQGLLTSQYQKSNVNDEGDFVTDSRLRKLHYFPSYDATGNVVQQTSLDGTITNYQWGYNNSLVTGFIVNPGDRAHQYSYNHQPFVGLNSTADPNGQKIQYEFDSFNRLKLTRDHSNNIISRYRYHYREQEEGLNNSVISVPCAIAGNSIAIESKEDPETGSTSYAWDFGDGTSTTSTFWTTYHLYPQSGTYILKVKKENPEHFSLEATRQLVVHQPLQITLATQGPTTYDICSQQPAPPTVIMLSISGDIFSYKLEYQLNGGVWYYLTSGSAPFNGITVPSPPGFGSPPLTGIFSVRCTAADVCGNSYSKQVTLINYASNTNCR